MPCLCFFPSLHTGVCNPYFAKFLWHTVGSVWCPILHPEKCEEGMKCQRIKLSAHSCGWELHWHECLALRHWPTSRSLTIKHQYLCIYIERGTRSHTATLTRVHCPPSSYINMPEDNERVHTMSNNSCQTYYLQNPSFYVLFKGELRGKKFKLHKNFGFQSKKFQWM